jgi:Outer membrane protein and related peptidoglycan-associated (lipo)proteins
MRNLILIYLWVCVSNVYGQEFILKKLDISVNTETFDEIAPCISSDGQRLFYTRTGYPDFDQTLIEFDRDLSVVLPKIEYNQRLRQIYHQLGDFSNGKIYQSEFNQDIWEARWNGKKFKTNNHPAYPLNNALPNSVSSFGPNDKSLIVINQFVEGGGMAKGFSIVNQEPKGNWGFPSPLPINNYHNSGEDVNLTMSNDGKVIILSMEREDGMGKSDLYICFKEPNGNWSHPENMGSGVNSPWRETTPHLSSDGLSLYFASNRGYTTSGGSDIYVQERVGENWKNWSAPRRFKAPINSDAHDSHPYFNSATGHLYFSSTRDGSSDIFMIQISEPKPILEQAPIAVAFPQAKKVVVLKSKKIKSRQTKHSLSLLATNHPIIKTPATIGEKIEMNPILFRQSKAEILPRSYFEIERVADYLHRHPFVKIRVIGHTDNQGDTNQLYLLSRERALQVVRSLAQLGNIDTDRMEAVGHGGDLPVASNLKERGRRKNRRVEIEIIDTGISVKEEAAKVGIR